MFDRILIQRLAAETKTKGGVLIPEKAQTKVQSGTVLAVGSGIKTDVSRVSTRHRYLSKITLVSHVKVVMFTVTLMKCSLYKVNSNMFLYNKIDL